MMKIYEVMLIGGGMATPSEKARASKSAIARRKCQARSRQAWSRRQKARLQDLLAHRHGLAPELKATPKATVCDVAATPRPDGLDIGPKTIAAYSAEIAKAKTMSGTYMGVFANARLAQTAPWKIAKAVAQPPRTPQPL